MKLNVSVITNEAKTKKTMKDCKKASLSSYHQGVELLSFSEQNKFHIYCFVTICLLVKFTF